MSYLGESTRRTIKVFIKFLSTNCIVLTASKSNHHSLCSIRAQSKIIKCHCASYIVLRTVQIELNNQISDFQTHRVMTKHLCEYTYRGPLGDVVHIYKRIFSAIRKYKILSFVTTWIEIILVSKISQTVKVEIHMISLICGI
uniref:Uncharacterized protein n=1 Tax=Rousettus aegyptiacus TaxID=9407 RepID=A0A7J8H152_ROUAE|nr:hypothetical protein HJG63_011299 [Rousettus aegyptiacus]